MVSFMFYSHLFLLILPYGYIHFRSGGNIIEIKLRDTAEGCSPLLWVYVGIVLFVNYLDLLEVVVN